LALTAVIPTAETLVTQCINGEPAAYRALYDRYNKAMYNTALRIVNNVPDAEDILQESFIDAFRQLKTFEQRSTFGAWLKQIVIFKSIGLLKKRKVQLVPMDIGMDLLEDKADESESADNTWYTVDLIREAMQQLPDGYRTVLSLYLLEGFGHEEIAESLGVAHSTVRTQYMRGKEKLIELLKKREVYER
jgi:RNA polymerase sigma factor (sigma-70 family)